MNSALDSAFRGALAALLLLLIVMLWRARGAAWSPAARRTGIAFLLSLLVQTVSASPWAEYRLACVHQAPGIGISLGSGVLFWLFARTLFDDGFCWRAWHGALWLAVVALGATVCWRVEAPGPVAQGLQVLMRLVPVLCAAGAVWAALAQWRADLVERRLTLRAFIVGAGALYSLALVAARVGSADGRLSAGSALVDTAAMTLIVAVAAVGLLRLRDEVLFGGSRSEPAATPAARPVADTTAHSTTVPAATAAPADPDQALAAALAQAMGPDRAYRHEGLSISTLAARLKVPEYRLRRTINQRLGHRNFNTYVNGLRLAEVKQRLADPACRHLPVLTLALDAGFQSIGPFNRAFKAETGLTPSDFRRRRLAEF